MACAAGPSAMAQRAWRDGKTPITLAEIEEMMRAQAGGKLTCVRTPDAPDGPYYLPSSLQRRALTEGRPGVRVRLGITVANALIEGNSCAPLRGAIVDIWQADAVGEYSNLAADLQTHDTSGGTFLRGHQVTDDNGYAEFDTIVPGWYVTGGVARAPHIHMKVFHEYKITTAQLSFPDDLIDEIYATEQPYAAHRSEVSGQQTYQRIPNSEDIVFDMGFSAPMTIARENKGVFAAATVGIITMGVNGTAPPAFR